MESKVVILNNLENLKKGIALTVGLNAVNPEHYDGWSGELDSCENDAKDMAKIANSKNYQVKTLLTKDATRENVINEISEAAKVLKTGDIFMLSYSGHGSQLPDINGDELENGPKDTLDETMCLYDGELVDDELNNQFAKFAEGVRVLVFSDSCHSGTVIKAPSPGSEKKGSLKSPPHELKKYRKSMPGEFIMRVYNKNKDFYDPILKDKELRDAEKNVKASVLLISGCQDDQSSYAGETNSIFTSQLLYVCENGGLNKNYIQFYNEIKQLMPDYQMPNYYLKGKKNTEYENEKVFEI